MTHPSLVAQPHHPKPPTRGVATATEPSVLSDSTAPEGHAE